MSSSGKALSSGGGPLTISGPAAETLIQARKNFQTSHDQLLKTKKKLIDTLHEQKRAEAALEEIQASPTCKSYLQAGRAFMLVPREQMLSDLEEKARKNKAMREQLGELEKALGQRMEQSRAQLTLAEEEIKKEIAMKQNAVQAAPK
eukprot:Gregarina_sp_Pseudo_9__3263@NODE_3446_length_647_cov_18_514803_g3145_i0_p1_GENE_NODE_3446_length_647_cov_18_514803_g3145_i0NODE_3446_length_647_cov_18_514803_g3145_i0_p1_ORF_typecomplete_len147_score20_59Prefoldin_2/PF01920_20/5_8e05Csm1_B/PF18211_1/29Csm1_B/PF18211_1/0_076Rab_eff_C/PF04698_12/0_0071Leu_zip/PF15294_6/0_015Peptidase_S37/PF05576_11/0_026UPF0449/PF15136_6/11UPF0449/PF15136_6/1_6ThiI/PF02568_14/0_15ATPsynt_B/PF00430_18/1_5ATPsynt_B/PF00430_18/7_2SHE3/PF17078_5/37SHE3/PF17078_5/0_4DU